MISDCSMIPRKPPIAEPRTIPTRFGSKPLRPASSIASLPAATASTTLRSRRRASFGETTSAGGSKSFTSAAMRTADSLASNAVIQSMPLRPATAASQVAGASLPSGVTAPSPVTATRLTPQRLRPAADPERDLGAAGATPAGARALAEHHAPLHVRARPRHLADRGVRPREQRLRFGQRSPAEARYDAG